MQIPCKRFSCQKAVEVCYWSCRFRKICKDWQQALQTAPGATAIQARLEAAAARSGRAFDPQTLDLQQAARPARKQTAPRAVIQPQAPATLVAEPSKSVMTPVAVQSASPAQAALRVNQRIKAVLGTATNLADIAPVVIQLEQAPRQALRQATTKTKRASQSARKRLLPRPPEGLRQASCAPEAPPTSTVSEGTKTMNANDTTTAPPATASSTTKHPTKANAKSAPEKMVPGKAVSAKPARSKTPANGTVYLLLQKNGKYKEVRESELLAQAALILKNPALRLVKGQLLVPTISFQTQED